MKRFFLSTLGGALLALALAAPALAQTYPGVALRTIYNSAGAVWDTSVLAPGGNDGVAGVSGGKSAATTGNSVTLNALGAAPAPDRVVGALNFLDTAALSGNQAAITGGTTVDVFGAFHWLANGDTSANGNQLTVSGGSVADWGMGGWAYSDASGNAQASGNQVRITGGTHAGGWFYGAEADADGAGASASVSNNTVTITGGSMADADGADAYASANGSASASGNKVDIQGGTITGWVYGGYARGGTAIASNNTVQISGTPDLSSAWIHGGAAATSSGNTLQMQSAGLTVAELFLFQKLNFQLPAIPAAGTPVLTVTGQAFAAGNALTVQVSAPGLTVHTGDTITLISAGTLNGAFTPASGTLNGYAYTLAQTGNRLVLTVGARAAPAATAVPALTPAALALLAALLGGVGLLLRRKA